MDWVGKALNPQWVGPLIGLVGVAVALILYRASRVGARPAYQSRALRLIGPDEKVLPEEVEIRFKGQPVDRLTKTHIVLWNSGKALLRGSDIVETDPLRCDFSQGSRVLEVRVVKASRAANEFEARPVPDLPNRVLLTFDYLDLRDGAVVEILHTDSKPYPEIMGTIRGVPRGAVDWGPILPPRTRGFSHSFPLRNFLYGMVIIALAIMAYGIVSQPYVVPPELVGLTGLVRRRIDILVSGAMSVAFPLLVLWLTRRRFPKNLSIPELEE